jgi:hypothetical protein
MLWFARGLAGTPQPKLLVGAAREGFMISGLLFVGSGVAQALLPQTSALDKLLLMEPKALVGAGSGALGWLGVRLNTELVVLVVVAAAGGEGMLGCGAGAEKSKRSPRAADAGAGAGFGAAGAVGDASAPNAPMLPVACFGWCVVVEGIAGFGSKKEPPPRLEKAELVL